MHLWSLWMYLYIHMHCKGSYICVSVCVAYLQERSTNKLFEEDVCCCAYSASGWIICRRGWKWEWMKELRGGAVDRYLSLLVNHSLRSTDHPSHLHILLLLHHHHPQHLQFIMLDHESIKKRRGEETIKRRRERCRKNKRRLRKEIKPGHDEDMLITCLRVVESLLYLWHLLDIKKVREGRWGEDLTKRKYQKREWEGLT